MENTAFIELPIIRKTKEAIEEEIEDRKNSRILGTDESDQDYIDQSFMWYTDDDVETVHEAFIPSSIIAVAPAEIPEYTRIHIPGNYFIVDMAYETIMNTLIQLGVKIITISKKENI